MKKNLMKYRQLRGRVKQFPFFFCFMLMLIVALPSGVFGKMPRVVGILREEMSVLPRWCQIRMLAHPRMFNHLDADEVSDVVMRENAKYSKIIGSDIYVYTHHYCRGLNWINRYKHTLTRFDKDVKVDRKYALRSALGDFHFMRNHLEPRHKLYAPNLMNEAYVYWEQKDFKRALKDYIRIMQTKPTYAPVYVKYAELLKSVGNSEEAINVLQIGLRKTKGDPAIKKALLALGGTSTKK